MPPHHPAAACPIIGRGGTCGVGEITVQAASTPERSLATLPSDYTSCEAYRGLTIAIRYNWYSVFTDTGARWPETYQTREATRRSIDFDLDQRHGRKTARPTVAA